MNIGFLLKIFIFYDIISVVKQLCSNFIAKHKIFSLDTGACAVKFLHSVLQELYTRSTNFFKKPTIILFGLKYL